MMALAVLQLVAEAPMHPYEMKQKMHERGTERAIPLKGASIYDTVERLAKAGVRTVFVGALPIDGKVVLRVPKEERDEQPSERTDNREGSATNNNRSRRS